MWLSGPAVDTVVERTVRKTVAELAVATDAEMVVEVVERAVNQLSPARHVPEVRIRRTDVLPPTTPAGQEQDAPERHTLINVALPGHDSPVGVLMVDRTTAARSDLRLPLEVISVQTAEALERLRLTDEINRYRSHEQIEALIEQTTDVVLIVDEDHRIRYASPSARVVFGTSAFRDAGLLDLIDPAQRRSAEFMLGRAHSGRPAATPSRADWTIRTAGGRTALVEVSCRGLRVDDSVPGVVITMRDVTAQRRLEHELTQHVFYDPLTGLPNRTLFTDRLDHAIAASTGPAGLLLIDLDNFKAISDEFGYDIADEVLKQVSRRLIDAANTDDVVARVGTDEFAVLILTADSVEAVDGVAAHVAESLSTPVHRSDGTLITCDASVGVATTTPAGSPQELLRNARLALSNAKSDNIGRWRHYQPSMTEAVRHQAELRSTLRHAIHDGSLFVEYQPIVSLATGRTVGLEALIRWQHPTRGRLLPGTFIDIAEESGLITPMGEWVLTTATNAARQWHRAAPDDAPYLSVNVSAEQFRSSDFADAVHGALTAAGLPPHRLVLEITESLLLRDDDDVWECLRLLRNWGIRIAIDDFGTGYSALGYLRQVPLDIVKLDRVFIRTLTTSSRQRRLVEGIVSLTRTLNLDVVAEGIETERQREASVSVGCRYGQGYLFSRAMPEDDVAEWLSKDPPERHRPDRT